MILVELGEDLIDELALAGEAEVDEGVLQLRGVHDSGAIIIEDVEGLLDLGDFFSGEIPSDIVVHVEGGGLLSLLFLGRLLGSLLHW